MGLRRNVGGSGIVGAGVGAASVDGAVASAGAVANDAGAVKVTAEVEGTGG